MDRSDEEIRLRDQFAMSAMQALITNLGLHGKYIDDGEEHSDSKNKLKRMAIIAYKVADEMRQARLRSFT